MNTIPTYLIASDFDQTLSFNDSGFVLSEMLGVADFAQKVSGLSQTHLVHQGAELAYLLRHDPQFRQVRRQHLEEAGRRVRLKKDIDLLCRVLHEGLSGAHFEFYVISAAPVEVVRSALNGLVPPGHICGAELDFDGPNSEISAVRSVPAGYGKVVALKKIEERIQVSPDRTIYIGDGSSDLYVMQHVNSCDGHTIAVSDSKSVGRIAQRSVLSDNALSVLVPILEDIFGWNSIQIRSLFASHDLALRDWDKVHTDWLTFGEPPGTGAQPRSMVG